MNINVYVPQLDENNHAAGYTVRVDRDAAIAAGAERLGAAKVGKSWYYKADETGEVWRLTNREVASFGAGRIDGRGVDYTLWCSGTGSLVKRPSQAVRQALGIE